jgi:hypothetical protein
MKKFSGLTIQRINIAYKFPLSIDVPIKSNDIIQELRDKKYKKSLSLLDTTATKAFSLLSLQKDVERIWGTKLQEYHISEINNYAKNVREFDRPLFYSSIL